MIYIIKRLSLITLLLTYILMVFGGYVASSNSGMGCGPDWPLCNGKVIPTLQGDTLIEFTHRVIGAILFIFSFILFLQAVRSNFGSHLKASAYLMFTLLIIEVVLGAVVVVYDLPSIVVTIHLLIATMFIATLVWMWRRSDTAVQAYNSNYPKGLSTHINIILVLLVFTIGLGAYIKHSSYGLACSWLDCHNTLLPTSGPQLLQSLHRYLAILSSIYILFLTLWAHRRKLATHLNIRLAIATALVFIQITVGILAILTNLAILWAVLHLATGLATFIFLFELRIILSLPHSSSHIISVN